jgi:hypothetical protein
MSRLTLAAGVVVLALATGASADVVFNNFGAGDAYNTGTGYTISAGAPINTDWDQGNSFVVTGDTYSLTSIEVAIGYVTGTNMVTFTLHEDNAGVPGNVLESFDFVNMGPFGNNNAPMEGASVANPTLQEGSTYWLIASSANNSWLAWNLNSIGDTRPRAARQNLGPWGVNNDTSAVFRINGVVPAPGALALLGVGLLGVRRRRS